MEFLYIMYIVGHFLFEWICYVFYKSPSDILMAKFLMTCLLDSILNFSLLYGLSEHYFNMLEGMLNLWQSHTVGNFLSLTNETKNCVDSMNFAFELYCCIGAVLQIVYFAKYLRGQRGGDLNIWEKIAQIVSVLFSLFSVYVAIGSVFDTRAVRSCGELQSTSYKLFRKQLFMN